MEEKGSKLKKKLSLKKKEKKNKVSERKRLNFQNKEKRLSPKKEDETKLGIDRIK